MGFSLSDLNPFSAAKKVTKAVAKPFRKASKFLPREMRWMAPYLSAAVPFALPGGYQIGGLGSGMSRGIMSALANVGGQAIADPEGEDINLLSTLLAGGTGALGAEGMGRGLRRGIEGGAGPWTMEGVSQQPVGFFQGAENLGREGLAQAADFLGGSAEGLASLGQNPASLFTAGGAKAAATDIAPLLVQGTGDVTKASTDKYRRDYEAADLEEQRQMDETSTANDAEAARLTMKFNREAGNSEEVIQETLALNDLSEYYEPPVEEESAAQGGIIGLKNGGRIGFKKGGWDPGAGRDKRGYQTGHTGGAGWSPGAGGAQHIPKKKTVVTGGANTPVIKDTPVRADPNFNFGVNIGQGLGGADLAKLFNNYYKLSNLDNETNPNTWDYNPPTITTPYADPILNEVTETFTDQSFLDTLADIKNRTQNQLIDLNLGMKAGGIIGLKNGGMLNLGGNEMDYRGGGFVPIGKRERADDVPARLSKNEFVMTADAVKAAGGGSVNKGAQRMYNVMNNLEARA